LIVLDTSALVAILNNEVERPSLMAAIAADDRRMLSAVSLLEARLVMRGRFGTSGVADLEQLVETIEPEIVSFDSNQADAAFAAFEIYGKGINSKSRLNFGDCIAYALAKSLGAPLLFKGQDFAATDITPAA
jgi:ribonuclease VapC